MDPTTFILERCIKFVFGGQKRLVWASKIEKRDEFLGKHLEDNRKMPIFATSECRQRARTICFQSKIQAGPF